MPLSDLKTIKAMWGARALSTKQSDKVTHRDTYQRLLEVEELASYLRPDDVVLDVGCGNGWATFQLAPFCRQITGIDYSEEMIERARAEHGSLPNCSWDVRDALTLNEPAKYDAVITVRCLINIVDRALQWQAIANLAKALKPGGRLLMLEGIADGRQELNRIRSSVGLAPMPTVHHNLDFEVGATTQYLRTHFSSVEFRANGIYDLVTRVVYPLMVKPQEPVYDSPYHSAAYAIAQERTDCAGLSRFGLFLCVK